MKIFLRVGIILAVALLVVGAAMAVAQVSGSSSATGQPQGITEQGGPPAGFTAGGQHADGGDRDGGGLSGLTGLVKNLVNVGWVVVAVVIVTRGWKLLQNRLRRRGPGQAAA
jgi:hypothetical protein